METPSEPDAPKHTRLTDAEFDRHVRAILARELGPGGFVRYPMLHRSGKGDYTAERHQWLDGIPIKEIERELMPESGH